jgi:peroxiredoxin
MGAARQPEMLRAHHRAPAFQLAQLGAGRVALHELLSGGPVLLAFFKSSCPVCQMTFPFLERIHRGRAPKSLGIYGVSQDDSETTAEFNAEFGITFPTLLDTAESGYPASNAYGISHVPSMFLVDDSGKIAWSLEGFNRRELEAVASQAGVKLFRPGEKVPDWKPG